MMSRIDELLDLARQRQASDVLIVPNEPPVLRVHGDLTRMDWAPMDKRDQEELLTSILNDMQRDELERERELDFSYYSPGVGRFRMNLHYERGGLAAAIRVIPDSVPTLEELGLPLVIGEQLDRERGLVLITGPTGSGKTTTLAALVGLMNETSCRHIITIEDPIEYYHDNRNSLVEQREVGADTPSFGAALRHVLRQDPDVIVLGEMRDLESISTAVTAAETGHLVLATLHTGDATQTIHRIIDAFPGEQQNQIRSQLIMSLHCVVSQRLIPCRDGVGRIAAAEVMMVTPAIRNLMRNSELSQVRNVIQTSSAAGMTTLDQSIQELYEQDLISYDDAMARAIDPQTMSQLIRLRA